MNLACLKGCGVWCAVAVLSSVAAYAEHLTGDALTAFTALGLADKTTPGQGSPLFNGGANWGTAADAFDDQAPNGTGRVMMQSVSSSNPFYVTYTFGNRTQVTAFGIWFTPSHPQGWNNVSRAPKVFALYGTNDPVTNVADVESAEWTCLHEETDETGWSLGEKRYYRVQDPGAYATYMWKCTGDNGGGYVAISELEYFEEPLQSGATVTVTPRELASLRPDFTSTVSASDWEATPEQTFTAPDAVVYSDDRSVRWTLTGYKLYKGNADNAFDLVAEGSETTKTLTYDGSPYKLEWQYESAGRATTSVLGGGGRTCRST